MGSGGGTPTISQGTHSCPHHRASHRRRTPPLTLNNACCALSSRVLRSACPQIKDRCRHPTAELPLLPDNTPAQTSPLPSPCSKGPKKIQFLCQLLTPLVFTCSGFHKQLPQTGHLEQQKWMVSWFWRVEVCMKMSAGLAPPESSLLGSLVAVSSPCPHLVVPVCVSVSQSPLLTSPVGLQPMLMTSFKLNYMFTCRIST